ncbi:MAG: hypothetical protein ABT07_02455 [Microbacterium sp. SCN 70-10]|nr:MAG: hypothetical protein ABT07_02455 [Microbacterium sp. SCN 70-10]
MTQLVRAAEQDGGGLDGRPLFVSDSWALSAPVIVATGDSVLTDGGYSGSAPVFTESALRSLVSSGRAHLFVVASNSKKGDPVRGLVRDDHCRSEDTWDLTAPKEGGEAFGVTSFTLYSCS